MSDPRPLLFSAIDRQRAVAALIAAEPGIVVQTQAAAAVMDELGLVVEDCLAEGRAVRPGAEVIRVSGSPVQIALAEERLAGMIAKPSGIATATRRFVERANGRIQIVSGAWKKLPFAHKEMIRAAICAGGAAPRIADWPFVYIDKNFVRMLGGVEKALDAARQPGLDNYQRIVQVTNSDGACAAAGGGADIVFVDTGEISDLIAAVHSLRVSNLRDRVRLAFGGGVQLDDIDTLRDLDVDIVDVGRAIVDAPLLDMSLQVLECR